MMSQHHESMPDSLPGFDLNEGLNRVEGNTELYKKLLFSFSKDNKEKAQQIQKALEANDFATARHLVHSLKGVSGNMSAKRLFAAAKALEFQLKRESRENLPELLAQFAAALNEVFNSLDFLASLEITEVNIEPDDSPIVRESLAESMKELAVLLREFNMNAEQSFQSLSSQLSQHEFKQPMQKLDNAINNLEFDTAAEILSGLADTLNIRLG